MKLATFDEVLGQLESLERAPAPALAWPLAHCAQSIELSLSGYPRLRAWPVRALIGPLVKRRFLSRGEMSHDTKAPIDGAPEISAATSFAEAAARLRKAIDSFRAHQGPLAPHFAYGECSKAEYEKLHAMHAANHLS
jgi:hypothetical protein